MVKKRGIVWNYFIKKVDGTQVVAFCKFCNHSYIQNATRMERHMERCPKCPDDIRQQFIQVAHNKKQKTNILDIKINDVWSKQESSMDRSIPDTELEELDNWNYKSQSYSNETHPGIQQNTGLITQNNDEKWANHDTVSEDNDTETSPANKNWGTNQSNTGPVMTAGFQDRTSSIHQRKSYSARRISQWPTVSMRASTYSPLQSKIHQEQLLERRALRRAAELELRRKTLELEKFEWEYEREKAQMELRWAHEIRMMELIEERERQLMQQSKTSSNLHS